MVGDLFGVEKNYSINGYLSNLIRILLREIGKKSNKKRAMHYDSFDANCYRSIVTRVVNSTERRNDSMIFSFHE